MKPHQHENGTETRQTVNSFEELLVQEWFWELPASQKVQCLMEVLTFPSKRSRFVPPTPNEVTAYARQIGYGLDGQRFCDFYSSKGWKVGNQPMKDWRAAVRTWVNKSKDQWSKGTSDNDNLL